MQNPQFNINYYEPNDQIGFNKFDLDYWKTPQLFRDLISDLPVLESVLSGINAHSSYSLRKEIATILQKQYRGLPESKIVLEQIEKLKEANTFTVICAHQPCLLGGPMYWAYKILTTIKLCNWLNTQFPGFHFIPVYYSGTEDHDFNEINHIYLFQKTLSWNEQSGIAVGKLSPLGINPVLKELEELFQRNEKALEFIKANYQWIEQSETYSDYYRYFVNALFGDRGLIYFNPDDYDAKVLFKPIIEREIKESFIESGTIKANSEILSMNYSLQVNPRDLNLFYHHSSGRKRITRKNENFQLVDTDIQWTEQELLAELNKDPSKFSPNVLLRPLYQEFLFPNVAFVGGGGEIAYWLQLKNCFNLTSIPYPILIRRFSAFYYDTSLLTKIAKTPYNVSHFLQPIQELEKDFIKNHAIADDEFESDLTALEKLLESIKSRSVQLDASTRSSIESELQKIYKSLEHISTKRNKMLKQKYEQDILNIQKIRELLYPMKSMQERIQSFLPYYLKSGKEFFDVIENSYIPFESKLALIQEK